MDADEPRANPDKHEVGMRLDDLSVDELGERIAQLKAEIARLEKEIENKSSSRSAADSFFKL